MTETDYKYDNLFARTIREARSKTPYNQTEAAALIGLDRAYYSALESGSQTTRSPRTIAKIARFYHLDPADLQTVAPETNIRTVKDRTERATSGSPLVRTARRMIAQNITPEEAEPYVRAAERLDIDPDDLFASFNAISPDIIAWLKETPDHARQVRKLMEEE